jgi:hypothetical protein
MHPLPRERVFFLSCNLFQNGTFCLFAQFEGLFFERVSTLHNPAHGFFYTLEFFTVGRSIELSGGVW